MVAAVVTMNTWMMTLTVQCIEYSLVYNEDALVPTTIRPSFQPRTAVKQVQYRIDAA